MNIKMNIRITTLLVTLLSIGIVRSASAREDIRTSTHRQVQRTDSTASGCQPATAAIDLDINNLRARLMTGGDMWWNIGEQVAAYEIPINSGKSSQFAASCWIGGIDQQGQLKVAAQTYRQTGNDYWPGVLDVNAKITSDVCANWDYFWKIEKSTINDFIQLYKSGGSGAVQGSEFSVIQQWPGYGNPNATGAKGTLNFVPGNTYAPFVDVDGNGVYDPSGGDYPDIKGDEFIWWVFNDAGNVKEQSLTAAIGVEVQTSAFAFATQDYLNNASFYNYRVINRGQLTIDSTYIAVWDDCDLGYYYDDFIGCDTSKGLGIQYNGTNCDGCSAGYPVNSYGEDPPQVGLNYFQGPLRPTNIGSMGQDTVEYLKQLQMTNFTYYNNDNSVIGNPNNGIQIYYYMTGSISNGAPFTDDYQGPGVPSKGYGSGPKSNFVFTGDPGTASWNECTCTNNPGDRRFIFSSGPFTLKHGAINDITFGCIWANNAGGCPNTSFTTIKSIDEQALALFKSDFKTVEGPQAPRMVCRELDRRLVFYLVNDYGSNNYNESYGRNDKTSTANYADSLQYHQIALKAASAPVGDSTFVNGQHVPSAWDSLYKFQGYRVFQLANSEITPAQIFDPTTGEVDNTVAVEVFQCDVRDSIKTIINYVNNTSISDSTWVPQIKVQGKDSGITHSFEITQDAFSNTPDKTVVNYQNYYFVAIAYAYNDFTFNKLNQTGGFDDKLPTQTQDVPYLASSNGANDIAIPVVVAMPNPSNGAIGTVINSDFGSGITVTRIEGVGNGGNFVELDPSAEATALANNQVDSALYANSQGPINVTVVDPVKVPAYNWVMQIVGPSTAAGVVDSGSWTLTAYQNGKPVDTIFSTEPLGQINQQILENYGLGITVNQVQGPGANQNNGNGYLSSDVQFSDPSKPWLFGVKDAADSVYANWLRSGNNQSATSSLHWSYSNPCNYNDLTLDLFNAYENMFANYSFTQSTWGPYKLAAPYYSNHQTGADCAFEVAWSNGVKLSQDSIIFSELPDVDLVFTADKSQWTRCAVIEEQDNDSLAQGFTPRFYLRSHASWNGQYTGTNTPVYSTTAGDTGLSYFPGYAINEGTGQRLNIVFGEDSWLGNENGADMLWNPTSDVYSNYDGTPLFGGKHVVYILGTKYDSDASFVSTLETATKVNLNPITTAYSNMQWVGIPTLNPNVPLTSLADGLIPTTTRLQFRVDRPYAPYAASDTAVLSSLLGVSFNPGQLANPLYTFSTSNLAPTPLNAQTDRGALLNNIYAVPNPYYGYSGYETNRFDTRVRIINLPAQVSIYIYALDGSLVRTLSKNDPNTSYIDWDIRNNVGLPIASGMYLMDVKAVGIGETVIKWFGASRPIDVTTF